MGITDLFIRRPVLAFSLHILILILGIICYHSLTARQYPKSDLAVVKVTTAYVGAPAELVRGFITTPLERVLASADGIDYLESQSQQGLSTIAARLRLNFDVNAALTQIQAKVAQVRNTLPQEAEVPIIEVENADSRFASMYLSFSSEALAQNQITDYLMRVIVPQLSALPGVQRAEILGGRTYAMRIWLKPEKMAAMDISASDVTRALAENNFLAAVGNTKGALVEVRLKANTDLHTPEEFEALVVKRSGGVSIKLGEIADIMLGAENYSEDTRFGGNSAIFIGIWALPNANTLRVIESVHEILPAIRAVLPSALRVDVPYDGTKYIRNAISEVLKTLIETILIVIIVIYLFIGSLRSVLVPVVAIPLSLLGAFSIMWMFGFTINLLTLLAIVLSVGIVVDDAIVMLENIERHVREEGLPPLEAALKGARELVVPTIAMTITLAVVYTPIAFQGGLTGALFKEFALTLAGAVVVSGIVALTLSPVMASKLLKRRNGASLRPAVDSEVQEDVSIRVKPKLGFQGVVEDLFNSLRNRYVLALERCFVYKGVVLTFSAIFCLLILPFYMMSMRELAPREDQGIVFGIVQAQANSTLDQTQAYSEKILERFKGFPEYANSFQLIQAGGGFSGMLVKPWNERVRSVFEIERDGWRQLAEVPGVRVILTTPPPLPGGSDFPLEMVISSTAEPSEIANFADQLVAHAFGSGVFMFADSDLKFDLPEGSLEIDRNKVADLGLALSDVGSEIATYTSGNYINRFNISGRSYKVIPQIKREARINPEQILDLHIKGPGGKMIPISTFSRLEKKVGARQLNKFQQMNSAKIQGALIPGVSVDQGLRVLESKAREILPLGYLVDYAGESRQLRKEGDTLIQALLFAFILIFLVLAAQFESFKAPLVILLGSVPLALAGALLFVFLGFTSLNIFSQVGLITLIGLVAKNAILIVEFANHQMQRGLSSYDAAVNAATTRLRPVLMTSVATVVGHFPLLLASGPGAAARNSIGSVLVTGMVIGSIFTLFVVPLIYVLVMGDRKQVISEHG